MTHDRPEEPFGLTRNRPFTNDRSPLPQSIKMTPSNTAGLLFGGMTLGVVSLSFGGTFDLAQVA
jgi:hypothetical protein